MGGLALGRIVRYVAYNNRELVAIIIGINDAETGNVDVALFTNMENVNGDKSYGLQFHTNVYYSGGYPKAGGTPAHVEYLYKPGTWHFPPRDEVLLSVK